MSIKLRAITRQKEQIASSEKDLADIVLDDVGRQLTRPYQVRDLIVTAAATLTTGTKTELVAGISGRYLDLMQISFSNNSDAATTLVLSDESTTVRTFNVPVATATNQVFNFNVPLPQSAAGASWYVDLPDITGTTVTVNAEFSKEI